MDYYYCEKCNEEWSFYPEDYDFIEEKYPDICPLCDMPVMQMIKDIWVHEKWKGIGFMVKMLWIRCKKNEEI